MFIWVPATDSVYQLLARQPDCWHDLLRNFLWRPSALRLPPCPFTSSDSHFHSLEYWLPGSFYALELKILAKLNSKYYGKGTWRLINPINAMFRHYTIAWHTVNENFPPNNRDCHCTCYSIGQVYGLGWSRLGKKERWRGKIHDRQSLLSIHQQQLDLVHKLLTKHTSSKSKHPASVN